MRVAVIGSGFGGRVMAPVYRELGHEVEVATPRDAAAVARLLGRPHDLVSIHSPPFLHREHVLAALAESRAVLCDKPFGLDAGEAAAMRAAAAEAGALHFLNFEFRYQPGWRALKRLVEDGRIGRLTHINWSTINRATRNRPHGWLFDAAKGGGWLGALGSHVIDTLRWISGDEVTACGGIARTEWPIRQDADGTDVRSTAEDAFSAWFRLEGGATMSYDAASAAPVNLPQTLVLLGSEGALEVQADARILCKRHKQPDEVVEVPSQGGQYDAALTGWLGDVTAAVQDGRQIAPNFDDGLAAARVMDRLRESFARG